MGNPIKEEEAAIKELLSMKPEYKFVKELRPHCPVCKERLKGDNSIKLPYKCSCGTWRHDYMTLEFKVRRER